MQAYRIIRNAFLFWIRSDASLCKTHGIQNEWIRIVEFARNSNGFGIAPLQTYVKHMEY